MDRTKTRVGSIVGMAVVAVLTLAVARKRLGSTGQSEAQSLAESPG